MKALTKPDPASVSRQLDSVAPLPRLFHSLHQPNRSLLSLDADEWHIFSGNQAGEVSVSDCIRRLGDQTVLKTNLQVWDKRLYSLKKTLYGHNGSVLALEHAPDKKWLFSSSGGSLVRLE